MKIEVDPSGLTQEQREAVAGFILAYPVKSPQSLDLKLNLDTTEAEVAAAFGAPEIPLVPGAIAAPSIANADPLPIVPVAPVAITSLEAPIVPVPPAPTNVITEHAAPLSPASGVELDKAGMPWDGRIHSESKSKLADGSWRKKRGLDPEVLNTVENELRQVMGAAPAIAPQSEVIWPMPAPVPPAPVPPVAPVAPVAPSQDPRAAFVALIGRASAAIHGNKLTQAEVTEICAKAGVPALPLLANRLDLVDHIAAQVDALIASR
jgi:hypothetical protein